MDNLNYEQVYESCKKELAQQLDLSKNKDHFVACFRNLEEEDILHLFRGQSNNDGGMSWLKLFLNHASECRIKSIARQHALALLEDLS